MTVENEPQLPALIPESKTKEIDININRPYEKDGIVYFKSRIFERCSIAKTSIKDFKHAVLNNASGKNADFNNVDFRYAELNDCYFHGQHLKIVILREQKFAGAILEPLHFEAAHLTTSL